MNISAPITAQSSMRDVLLAYPGAQRALFRHYHIGGCTHCAFRPEETLAELCRRNQIAHPEEVIQKIQEGHDEDQRRFISPRDLARQMAEKPPPNLLDVRTREEWELTRIAGAVLMSRLALQEILARWSREQLLVIYDHSGRMSLDAAAYFEGQGFQNVRCLQGGIDAWSREIDSGAPRYRLEVAP